MSTLTQCPTCSTAFDAMGKPTCACPTVTVPVPAPTEGDEKAEATSSPTPAMPSTEATS